MALMIRRRAAVVSLLSVIIAAVPIDGFIGGLSMKQASSSLSATSLSNDDDRVKGVIFDIDGTLADSWNLGYQATKTVLSEYHNNNNDNEEESSIQHTPETYPLTSEEYHFGCRYTTPERLARHVGLEPDHPSFEEVGEDLGSKFDDYYVKLVDRQTAGFYDGIGELLVKLNSGNEDDAVQLGALTNACVEYAHAVLKANCPEYSESTSEGKIYHRFSSIHGANSVPRPKPFGDGILQCCKEMNLLPSEVIYVGDAPTDGRAAKDAECKASIGVLWGSNEKDVMIEEFTTLCNTVDELEVAIKQYL